MRVLLGKPLADTIIDRTKKLLEKENIHPCLVALLVGENPASKMYVELKERAANSIGIRFQKELFPASLTTDELVTRVQSLNKDQNIDGILIQLPLPGKIDTDRVVAALSPEKDVDGFHPETITHFLVARDDIPPVFPGAIRSLLECSGMPLPGKTAVVLANSNLFARIMTVTLERLGLSVQALVDQDQSIVQPLLKTADVVVTAQGKPGCIRGEDVHPGVLIIDGGIAWIGEKVVGDVEWSDFIHREAIITPVPRGVGPVTVATLMERTVKLALVRRKNQPILET